MRPAHALIRLGETFGALSIAAITLVVAYDVAGRALGHPTLWSLEVSGYLMIAASVLAAGEAARRDEHFQMRLVIERLPPRVVAAIDLAVAVVSLLFLAAVAWGCIEMMLHTHRLGMRSSTLLRIPLIYPQAVLCAGLVLLLVAVGLRLAGFLRHAGEGASKQGASKR